jgi:acid phosphatase type 7
VKVKWLRRSLWLVGFGCLWLPVLEEPPLRTGAYVQDVTTDAGAVAMVTAAPRLLSCVVRDALGATVARVTDASARRRHDLRITGLLPATKYAYELVDSGSGDVLDRGCLKTAPGDDRAPVRFAFLGDSGGLPWWVWLQRAPAVYLPARWNWLPDSSHVSGVGAAVAAYAPDFVLHLGDVVYPWGRNAQYTDGFFRPFAAVLRQAPMYAVIGNHDAMDSDGLQLLANFRLPRNGPTGDGRCFSFAWGPVRVIGLDCNVDRLGGQFTGDHPAVEFLLRELRGCSEPWIVVASHFPLRSQSRARNRGDLLVGLLPALRDHRVSLYLSGHDHCYQRLGGAGDPLGDGVPLVVSGGGGKSLYDVRPDPRWVLESTYHWCSAEAQGAALTIRSHRLDGTLVDAFDLRLPTGDDLAAIRRHNPARATRIELLGRH